MIARLLCLKHKITFNTGNDVHVFPKVSGIISSYQFSSNCNVKAGRIHHNMKNITGVNQLDGYFDYLDLILYWMG